MKNKLLLLALSVVLCLPTFAESMCVNLKNGETVSFDLEDIKDITICENIPVVDESETPLKFKILSENTVEVIEDASYKELNSVSVPAKVRIDGKVYDVTSIGDMAFYNCSKLDPKLLVYNKGTKCYGWIGDRKRCTAIVIPEGVISIGSHAFYYCSSLTSIEIPNSVTLIGEKVFYFCSSLTNISIPGSVTSIGKNVFEGCPYLDVVIDNSKNNVKVGYDAFKNCKSVTWLKD